MTLLLSRTRPGAVSSTTPSPTQITLRAPTSAKTLPSWQGSAGLQLLQERRPTCLRVVPGLRPAVHIIPRGRSSPASRASALWPPGRAKDDLTTRAMHRRCSEVLSWCGPGWGQIFKKCGQAVKVALQWYEAVQRKTIIDQIKRGQKAGN